MNDGFLPGVPADLVSTAYLPGVPEEQSLSSAALVANAFGWFLGPRAASLPPLPGFGEEEGWTAGGLALGPDIRFPWSEPGQPRLDVVVETGRSLIGIVSTRFEPFRAHATRILPSACDRPIWGERMPGYEALRDRLRAEPHAFAHLDAAALVEHAFALRSQVHRPGAPGYGKRPALVLLHAEPDAWPDGPAIPCDAVARHRAEIARFAEAVLTDEVAFHAIAWRDLLAAWGGAQDPDLAAHATAVRVCFRP